jgi:branched-chain amino acid transport system substrate-binding protein
MGSTHINLNQSRLTWVAVAMLWAFSASGYAGTTQVDDTHFRVGPDAQVKAVTIAALGSATSQTHDGGSQAISPTMDTPLLPYRTVRIGHVAPLTGGVAHLGKDNENGVRLAIDEANTAGTVIDRHLIRFELISADDKSDPKIGNVVAANLVAAGAVGVIGHLNSGTTIPASVIYNKAGIPVITGSATHPTLTEQGFKGVFRVVGRDDQQGPTVANYLIRHIQPKIVAVIDDATAYGEGLANEVEKTLRAAGVKVLPREKGTDKTVDWKAVLDNIKDRNPDAVFYGVAAELNLS